MLSTLPQRILVFRIGQLGDTIVALPAMWAVRRHFPNAELTLLCDRHPNKRVVLAADLLQGAGVVDRIESYPVDDSIRGRALRPWHMLRLLAQLRRRRYDLLIYLAPSTRTMDQVGRDRKFFAAAGIKEFMGVNGFPDLPRQQPGQPLGATLSEADLLLARLAAAGVPVPGTGRGSLELGLGAAEAAEVDAWLQALPADGNRQWLAIGPGSKMPAKRWPEERYAEVVQALIDQFDLCPVVFGGAEDGPLGERLLRRWGRGYNAAGVLSVRGAAAALKRCVLHLGNDSGTMHLAAAVGVPCVALFSAREWPGMWFPYGVRQRVFRSHIECEGCGLVECVARHNECMRRIRSEDVLEACAAMLRKAGQS
jgi:heptosyltransferase-3